MFEPCLSRENAQHFQNQIKLPWEKRVQVYMASGVNGGEPEHVALVNTWIKKKQIKTHFQAWWRFSFEDFCATTTATIIPRDWMCGAFWMNEL